MIVLPLPPQGGYSLQDYLFFVRRLLHDPSARMYPDEDLIRYINKARDQVARDTGCLRLQQDLYLRQNQETYSVLTDLPYGPKTVDVRGIGVYWTQTYFYQLQAYTYQRFNAYMRAWTTFRQRPLVFARMGGVTIYIGPIPDQDYLSQWDTIVVPNAMTDDTIPDQLPIPFQEPVPFFAAYWAKKYEQSNGEAEVLYQEYQRTKANAQGTWRRSLNRQPYG